MMNAIEKVELARRLAGIPAQEIAEEVGTTKRTIHRWLSNKTQKVHPFLSRQIDEHFPEWMREVDWNSL